MATNVWAQIERVTLDVFGRGIDQSSGRLIDSISCGARYMNADDGRSLLVFNRRAFLYGVLVHGLRGKTSDLPDEGDIWLTEWFQRQGIIHGTDEGAVPPGADDVIARLFGEGYHVILSTSMQKILERACDHATRTVGRPVAELRHLVAAFMMHQGDWPRELSWTPSLAQIGDWCETLLKHVNKRPGLEDDVMGWVSILMPQPSPTLLMSLGLGTAPNAATSSASAPDETVKVVTGVGTAASGASTATGAGTLRDDRIQLSGFSADRPGSAAQGDPLGITRDVDAFARLIAGRDTTLPLSIGIFGDWGTGKSTFMDRLEQAIDRLVQRQQSYFVDRVIHIRFNAWQFADANLWASLTAEFFEQLRVGGHAKQRTDRYDKLVERVNTHVHALSENATAARDALADSKEELVKAQQTRDLAVREVAKTKGAELSQSVLDAAGIAFEKHRGELADLLGIAEDKEGDEALNQFLDVARDLRSVGGQIKVIWQAVWHGGWRRIFAVITVLLLALLIYFGVEWLWGAADRPAMLLSRFGGWTALATLGTAIAAMAPAIKVAAGVLHSTASFADRLDKVGDSAQQKVLQSEIKLRAAAIEAKARQEAVDRASRTLARYVGPDTDGNPPHLLRYVLEDFPDTKEMEKEIGLISRARRLFESVDAIVRQEREQRAKGDGTLDVAVPDRIVLYIDDLDRCTPDQVYAVLQAIHLLLAFELFVVVVGVDVHWIEEALGKQSGLPDLPEGMGNKSQRDSLDTARRVKAIRYLEKIFQLPFWLRPLSTEGEDGGSYGRYVRALTTVPVNARGDQLESTGPAAEVPTPGINIGRDGLTATIDTADITSSPPAVTLPGGANDAPTNQASASGGGESAAATTNDSFAPMELSQNEVAFLASPLIGRLAAKDPRAVKRLINVYRILRASLMPDQLRALQGDDSTVPTYPIAIFLIAVDVGQPLEIADALYQGLKSWSRGPLLDLPEILKESAPVPEDLQPLLRAFRNEAAMSLAWAEVLKARNGTPVSIITCLDLARAIRRYSFNKY